MYLAMRFIIFCQQIFIDSLIYYRGNTGYWISFQDGLQRTVLFTSSKEIRDRVLMGNKSEQPTVDVTLSLIAVGLSLVNDVKGIEVAYVGIPQ